MKTSKLTSSHIDVILSQYSKSMINYNLFFFFQKYEIINNKFKKKIGVGCCVCVCSKPNFVITDHGWGPYSIMTLLYRLGFYTWMKHGPWNISRVGELKSF